MVARGEDGHAHEHGDEQMEEDGGGDHQQADRNQTRKVKLSPEARVA